MNTHLKAAFLLATPALMAMVAYLAAPAAAELPPELSGLQRLGPVVALAFAAAMAATFNRGRVLLGVLVLALPYAGFAVVAHEDVTGPLWRTVCAAISILVPANLAILSFLQERGLATRYGARRIAAVAVQVGLVYELAIGQSANLTALLWSSVPGLGWLGSIAIPPLGVLSLVLGFITAIAATFLRRSAIEAGLAGAIAAVGLAMHEVSVPLAFDIFLAFGGLMLAAGVLQEAYRFAFRDELTGLPSRRALNERLLALGDRYAIAMVDIDNFKQFNDRWGHDVGDQVLKMVASHLERLPGGGRGYRFGGEEFALVFGARSVREVMPILEAQRAVIERYELAIRAPDRPQRAEDARRAGTPRALRHSVSVTVSIGVAERDDRNALPDAVLRAADAALYRAKQKGRNRVSR
ncbi:MAG: GGDEF domain-containing protein [Betaproteobacteria bacterium]